MQYLNFITSLLMLCNLPITNAAAVGNPTSALQESAPVYIDGQLSGSAPHMHDNHDNHDKLDMQLREDFNSNITTVSKLSRRKGNMQVCGRVWEGWRDPICPKVPDLKALAKGLATIIKGRSDGYICDEIASYYGDFEFRYYSWGGDCHTLATVDEIAEGIEEYYTMSPSDDGGICETSCVWLTNGGDWLGKLFIGHRDLFNELDRHCGRFSQCWSRE